MSTVLEHPLVGIKLDMPEAEYHAVDACSNSLLNILESKSPAHVLEAKLNPPEPTPARVLGSAIHLAVLQPDLFTSRVVSAGQCAASKKDGGRCTNTGTVRRGDEWYCGVKGHDPKAGEAPDADAPGTIVLPAEKRDVCLAIRDSVWAHPEARRLLQQMQQGGNAEVSAFFMHPEHDILCKLRADGLVPDRETTLDLKSTEDASPAAFEKSIFNFGYYRQGPWYQDGLAVLGGDYFRHHAILAVEKKRPYAVGVYVLKPEVMEAGRDQLRGLVARYAACVRSGHWPAYPVEVTPIGIPPWGWSRIYDEPED